MVVTPELRLMLNFVHTSGAEIASTDVGFARIFASLYAQVVRHVQGIGWFTWVKNELGGGQWIEDPLAARVGVLAERIALLYLQAAAAIGTASKDGSERLARYGIRLLNHAGKSAALREAERRPEILCNEYPFDTAPHLINALNGVVDLRTGQLLQADPSMMCARMVNAAYYPNATSERWTQFLAELFCGKDDVVQFARLYMGYACTGSTREQCMLILWGEGANGKSSLCEVLLGVLGSYAITLPHDAFVRRRGGGEAATPHLAELAGRRLAIVPEWGSGRVLDTVVLKQVVGGDTIAARKLYRDPFRFRSSVKLMIHGNYRPEIRENDQGTWRRVYLLPFLQRFGAGGLPADPNIVERLLSERDGIFSDIVRGAVAWWHRGLQPPALVQDATTEYRLDSDDVLRFISERCEKNPKHSTLLQDLYLAYNTWQGELGRKQFAQALRALGYQFEHIRRGTLVQGLRLLPPKG